MFGAEAGEVMTVVQTAMLAGMPYMGLRDAIITHPTMAEGLVLLLSNLPNWGSLASSPLLNSYNEPEIPVIILFIGDA